MQIYKKRNYLTIMPILPQFKYKLLLYEINTIYLLNNNPKRKNEFVMHLDIYVIVMRDHLCSCRQLILK